VGGYASSWWFVLTQVLRYKNVKFYDGSAHQEWVIDYDMVPYQWD
jgi:thiosulfate/3-mercaptopyruvate sulfurtransferase